MAISGGDDPRAEEHDNSKKSDQAEEIHSQPSSNDSGCASALNSAGGDKCSCDEAHKAKERGYWAKSLSIEIVAAVIAGLAAIIASSVLVVYIGQLQAMRAQQEITSKQLDAAIIQLRPYISYEPIVSTMDSHNIKKFKVGKIQVSWKNYGVTPAKNLVAWTCVSALRPQDAAQLDFIAVANFENGISCPSGTPNVEPMLTPNTDIQSGPHAFKAVDLKAVVAKERDFYVWGEISYSLPFPDTRRQVYHFCDKGYFDTRNGEIDFAEYQAKCNFEREE